jgi:hypothetical protein
VCVCVYVFAMLARGVIEGGEKDDACGGRGERVCVRVCMFVLYNLLSGWSVLCSVCVCVLIRVCELVNIRRRKEEKNAMSDLCSMVARVNVCVCV